VIGMGTGNTHISRREPFGVIHVRAALLVAALVAAFVAIAPPATGERGGEAGLVLTIDIDGPIGPATARYVKEALATATERRAEIVILRLNTPGGLVTSMREIIADVLTSPVAVVGYVAPPGAHAASAGTYILYATQIAAMAPGTNLGAATPVELGGPLPGLPVGNDGKAEKGIPAPANDTMTAKVTNDAVALIRSLAELRKRNADWAEKAVREAASLSATAALEAHVIDIVARDTDELLERLDGRMVEIAGAPRRLATKGLVVETEEPGLLIRILSVITDPNVALILLLVGTFGLIFEFSTPGAVAPGVIGTICLLLGLYALNMLPINYAGLALMLAGVLFLVVEAFNPTMVLGLGGIAALLLGAAMLLKVNAPGYQVSWVIVGTATAIIFGLIALMGGYLWRARRSPVRIGAQAMRGMSAKVLDWRDGRGHVLAQGERWQATGEEAFAPGESVEVAGITGLTLAIRRRRSAAVASDGDLR
jgi:membrane-bound serine protease (ClpP class)